MLAKRLIFFILFTLAVSFPATADNRKLVQLTSTEWPPHTGEKLPEQGFMTKTVRETMAKAGYILQVDFSAWQRSLATAYLQDNYYGTLMVYYTPEKESSCHLTQKIATSLIGFVQRKDTPILWTTLKDLTGVRIGSVSGYFNTKEFDRLARAQLLNVSEVFNDLLNMRRVAFGRVEIAVIDKLTMQYFLQEEPSLEPYRHLLEFNPKPLATHTLHVCFNKTEEGRVLRDAFDKAFDPAWAAQVSAKATKHYSNN